MVLSPVTANDGSKIEWEFNSTGANSVILGSLNGGSWIHDGTGTDAAFDVLGTPSTSTPEPGSLLLLGSGLAGLLVARRRRNSTL